MEITDKYLQNKKYKFKKVILKIENYEGDEKDNQEDNVKDNDEDNVNDNNEGNEKDNNEDTNTCITNIQPSKNIFPYSPNDMFVEMIHNQKQKEEKIDIWKDSPYKHLVKLQSNNVGNVGETFMQKICDTCEIQSQVDGSKTKQFGEGDGTIMNKSVEIKTSHRGCNSPNFQHELGETPWKPEFMIFIDVSPNCIYLTIFKNFNEIFYKSATKCEPYFPTKSITWRKKCGAFKLDTTIKINEDNILNKHTFKIDDTSSLYELKTFILSKIE